MPSLQISALGTPEVRLKNEPIAVKPKKALALLIYLAAAERVQARDHLATLLWPDSGQRQARAALRRRLSELTGAIGEDWLCTDGDSVSLVHHADLEIDFVRFEQYIAQCNTHGHTPDEVCPECRAPLEAAVALYRDDFLAGFTLSDCPEYDDWQFFRAESLSGQLASALERLTEMYCNQGDAAAAIPFARRWTALDPLHEPAHRALMRAYDAAGQRSAALRQYDLCVRTLDTEIGVPPEAETTNLYEVIRTRQTPAPAPVSALKSVHDVPLGSTFAQAAPLDEVRMVTVLALDVDTADEEEWDRRPDDAAERIGALLQAAPTLLGRYEATITHIHDSGLRAVFGLPAQHEDDAERALHAALTLQESASAQSLVMSAGVSTGMSYVSDDQREERVSISGRPVSLAVRLKGQAPVGGILADSQTYRQTEQAFRFQPHGASTPGQEESFRAYEVLRPRRHTVKSRGVGDLRAPLIGRNEELTKLTGAWNKARHGDGQFVTLVGEAGLGKSRLVAELKARVLDEAGEDGAEPCLWTEGRCQEMMRSVPYWPFVDILQTSFGWTHSTSKGERARQLTSTLNEFVQEGQLTQDQVGIMGPILGQLLSLQFGTEWDGRLQNARPEQIRHQTFETLRDYAVAIAQRQPLVLVLEDMHWADLLSIDLAIHFTEVLRDTPLLLLCIYRPEAALEQDKLGQVGLRKCPANYSEIRLRELTPDDSRALVEGLLHIEGISAETKKQILDTCQGNPFFVEEVIHDLIEADVIYREGDVWRARSAIASTPVPTRVQSVILSRYDRLPPAQKETIQLAATIGRLFSKQVLAAAMPERMDVDSALQRLEEHAFVYPERTVPELVYSFRHALAQGAVYQTIPGQRRAAMHAQIGAALEALYGQETDEVVDQLAFHFDHSDASTKAIGYLLRAGDRAARTYMTDEAVRHYHRALERVDEVADNALAPLWRFHGLSELGKTLMRTSRYEEAEAYLRRAISWGKTNSLPVKDVVRLHWWLGDLLMNWNPRYEEMLQTGLSGLDMLKKADRRSAEAAMMYSIIAFGYYFRQDEERFQATTAHLASFLPDLPYTEEFRVCYACILDSCFHRKERNEFVRWLDVAQEQARRNHADWALSEHTWARAYALWNMGGEPREVLDTMRRSGDLFQLVGDAKRANWAEVALGEMMGDYGLSQAAEVQLRKALRSAYRLNKEHISDIRLKLASACMAQRKWSEVRKLLHEPAPNVPARPQNPAEVMVLQGFEALAHHDRSLAAEQFRTALHSMGNPDVQIHHWRKWWLLINSYFANALYGLECALDNALAFRDFCRDFRTQHPEAERAVFQFWALEPATAAVLTGAVTEVERFDGRLAETWHWCDPDGGCDFALDHGLTIMSPVARDLLFPLINAPRMMRPVCGDFAAQVRCEPACTDRPGIGGILLWQNSFNYLRLCIGVRAQDEMSLEGCIDSREVIIGRGRLIDQPVDLRMERLGDTVRALCSADGQAWLLVGEATLRSVDEEQIGLHAIGFPDRTIYHQPFPDGSAIRFTDFRFSN